MTQVTPLLGATRLYPTLFTTSTTGSWRNESCATGVWHMRGPHSESNDGMELSRSHIGRPAGLSGMTMRSVLAHENRPDEDVLDEVYGRFARSDPFLPI